MAAYREDMILKFLKIGGCRCDWYSWLIGLSSPLPANAQVTELKASLFVPPGNVFHRAMIAWADELKQKSQGRLIIKIFPAGQMGPAPRQFDLARTGVADIAVIFTGLTPGRFPLTELANVPGMLKGNYPSSLALSEIGPKLFAKRISWREADQYRSD